jgi:chitinase
VDLVLVSFLYEFFGTNGLPEVDFSGACSGPVFPGSDLLQCTQIGYQFSDHSLMHRDDIQTCQAAGKKVLLSLGGENGIYGFSSVLEAQTFATTLWNIFGEGNSSTRTFGSAVVDGFDLGIIVYLLILTHRHRGWSTKLLF